VDRFSGECTGTVCDLSDVTASVTVVAHFVAIADEDEDGVDDSIEDGAPNNGDANGDGTPDSMQPNIASLPGVNNDYLTLAVGGGCNITGAVNVIQATVPDADYTLNEGLLGFTLPCESAEIHSVLPWSF
jgi:hypothetical protein